MSLPLGAALPRPFPNGSVQQPNASAQKVVQTFNTWAFKREQPSDLALLESVAARAIERGSPLEFVLYWGKGPRSLIRTTTDLPLSTWVTLTRVFIGSVR